MTIFVKNTPDHAPVWDITDYDGNWVGCATCFDGEGWMATVRLFHDEPETALTIKGFNKTKDDFFAQVAEEQALRRINVLHARGAI